MSFENLFAQGFYLHFYYRQLYQFAIIAMQQYIIPFWCLVIRVTSETGIAEREKVYEIVRIFSKTIL